MKKLRRILLAVLLCVCSIFASGCYLTQAQTMKNVKGTYQLARYDRTDEGVDEEGKKFSTVTDEIEEKGLEVYLVVTGAQTGYYAYKSATEGAYIKEVAFTYETSTDDANKYTFVCFKDALEKEFKKLGVTKNSLNFSRPSIYTTIGKAELKQAGYNERWDKVDKATDISFIAKKWGEVPQYTYEEWANRGN